MKWMLVFVGSLFAMTCGHSRAVQAQTWGDLTMTVVFDGEIPPPKPMITQSGLKIMPEDLVVDPATKGIANMVFMIDSKKTKLGTKQLHPDLQELPEEKPIIDIVKDAFVPHVLAIRAGQTFLVKEGGSYNAKFNFFKNEEVSPMILAGANKEVFTKVEEPFPTKVECSIHPWMSGYVIVAGHPYVGVSDAAGKIKIEKLPAGIELDFKLWHESQHSSIEVVSFMGKKEKWTKGCIKLTLKEGANDFGTLSIKPDRFRDR